MIYVGIDVAKDKHDCFITSLLLYFLCFPFGLWIDPHRPVCVYVWIEPFGYKGKDQIFK